MRRRDHSGPRVKRESFVLVDVGSPTRFVAPFVAGGLNAHRLQADRCGQSAKATPNHGGFEGSGLVVAASLGWQTSYAGDILLQ
jgi:hypothetical protein